MNRRHTNIKDKRKLILDPRPGQAKARCRTQSSQAPSAAPEAHCTGEGRARSGGRSAVRGADARAARQDAFAKAGHLKTLYFTLVPFGIAVSSTNRQRMLQATKRTEMDCNKKNKPSVLNCKRSLPVHVRTSTCQPAARFRRTLHPNLIRPTKTPEETVC